MLERWRLPLALCAAWLPATVAVTLTPAELVIAIAQACPAPGSQESPTAVPLIGEYSATLTGDLGGASNPWTETIIIPANCRVTIVGASRLGTGDEEERIVLDGTPGAGWTEDTDEGWSMFELQDATSSLSLVNIWAKNGKNTVVWQDEESILSTEDYSLSETRGGGALVSMRAGRLTLDKCRVENMKAKNGGAIYITRMQTDVPGSAEALYYDAADDAAWKSETDAPVVITNTEFIDCAAGSFVSDMYHGLGGAIYIENASPLSTVQTPFKRPVIDNCEFRGCAARQGGALAVFQSSVDVSYSLFDSNAAGQAFAEVRTGQCDMQKFLGGLNDIGGGAVLVSNGIIYDPLDNSLMPDGGTAPLSDEHYFHTTFTGCTFNDNTAYNVEFEGTRCESGGHGGAVLSIGWVPTFTLSTFSGNYVNVDAGQSVSNVAGAVALKAVRSSPETGNFRDCIFDGNHIDQDGTTRGDGHYSRAGYHRAGSAVVIHGAALTLAKGDYIFNYAPLTWPAPATPEIYFSGCEFKNNYVKGNFELAGYAPDNAPFVVEAAAVWAQGEDFVPNSISGFSEDMFPGVAAVTFDDVVFSDNVFVHLPTLLRRDEATEQTITDTNVLSTTRVVVDASKSYKGIRAGAIHPYLLDQTLDRMGGSALGSGDFYLNEYKLDPKYDVVGGNCNGGFISVSEQGRVRPLVDAKAGTVVFPAVTYPAQYCGQCAPGYYRLVYAFGIYSAGCEPCKTKGQDEYYSYDGRGTDTCQASHCAADWPVGIVYDNVCGDASATTPLAYVTLLTVGAAVAAVTTLV